LNSRPDDLPEYDAPPLDEVVIGVQFSPAQGYTSLNAREVWDLFKSDYPEVQEHPPIEPSFETFGGSQQGIKFQLGRGPLRARLWFISREQDRLIQFQDDRLLLNWRKQPSAQQYPRFESISQSFEDHLSKLGEYFGWKLNHQLNINQVEISYINNIPLESFSDACDWLFFLKLESIKLETLNLNFSEVILNDSGKPFARLIHELQSVVTRDGNALRLSLSFKGTPQGSQKEEALAFIKDGRTRIVTRFTELTTTSAHEKWGRRLK
jgi:uncharacterized protein (TIGR04255 family)